MTRKGRPRKQGKRYPSGNLKKAKDRGADAVKAARQYLAGDKPPELAAYPLGIMCAAGDISEAQREAGGRYAWLYGRRYGRVSVAAAAYEIAHKGRSEGPPENWELDGKLQRAAEMLEGEGRRLKDVVEDIAVFERQPAWMAPRIPKASDIENGRLARYGLKLLAVYFGMERR